MDEPTNNSNEEGKTGIPSEEISKENAEKAEIIGSNEACNVEVSSVLLSQPKNDVTTSGGAMDIDLSPEEFDDDNHVPKNDTPISNNEESNDTLVETEKKVKRFQTIIDSDSEDDDVTQLKKNESSLDVNFENSESSQTSKKKLSRFRIDSDSDDDDQSQKNKENNPDKENSLTEAELTISSKKVTTKFSDLVDSESETENNGHDYNSPVEEIQENIGKKLKKSKSEKKKTGSKRASKDEAMRQIRSETQRLMRESKISLPYHRPKQRSLQEFMNRKKIGPILPEAATMAARLKMSAEIVSKIVEEKEKEAELFYKSSDSEDENTIESTMTKNSENKITESSIDSEKIAIVDTQKLHDNGIQDAHNKKQIIQQGSLELGVPRKLNLDNSPSNSQLPSIDNIDSEISEEKESKNVGVSRKLFDTNSENDICTSPTSQQKSPLEIVNGENSRELELSQNEIVSLSSEESVKNVDISETPTISQTESAKLNEKNLTPKSDESEISIIEESEESPEVENKKLLPSLSFDVKSSESQKSSIGFKKSSKSGKSVAALKPKLRGSSGMIIDLSDDVKPNKIAVNSLVDRFITKHSVASKHEEKHSEVSVINTEITSSGVEIIKDVLPYTLTNNETIDDSDLNKPGAKLVRLKEDLKKKMAMKRAEEWKQKEKEMKIDEEEYDDDDEEEKNELDEKGMDIIDEEEFDGEESEPEENDIEIRDKTRERCEFGDDEAEESENEMELNYNDEEEEIREEEEEEEEEEGDDDDENEKENNSVDQDESDNQDGKSDEDNSNTAPKKKLRRVVEINEDSSSDEEEKSASEQKVFQRTRTDVDLFDDDEDEENSTYQIPESPYVRNLIVSPLSQLSGRTSNYKQELSGKNSSPNTQVNDVWNELSDSVKKKTLHQKLYDEESSQVNDEELIELCSGKFTDTQNIIQTNDKPDLGGLVETQSTDEPTNTQLLNLCSGTFSTQPSIQTIESDIIDETSQDLKLTLDECSQDGFGKKEMEKVEKENWNQLKIVSSSDDDDYDQEQMNKDRKKILLKKKAKKLELSDDDDDDDDENELDDWEESEEEEKFIDYDSEENEIIVSKDSVKKVAANFVDEEAELSESEWGSEDEDEKDLDKLEAEEGDAEVIDEDKMRDQIGKMHARQLLDDDQRDVRMLKEMLFDDGDLHEDGEGRERKFKWRNVSNIGTDNPIGPINEDDDDDDDFNPVDLNDAADELKWRIIRMEREKFLEEKRKSEDAENELANGQIIKLGMKVLKKSKSISIEQEGETKITAPRTLSEVVTSPGGSKSIILNKAMKRGSFLARGDQALARLAVLVKQTDTVVLAPKNTRNFVFSHISPSIAGSNGKKMDEEEEEKMNDVASTSKEIRKRKSSSGITPRSTKKPKIDVERPAGKKLF